MILRSFIVSYMSRNGVTPEPIEAQMVCGGRLARVAVGQNSTGHTARLHSGHRLPYLLDPPSPLALNIVLLSGILLAGVEFVLHDHTGGEQVP